MSTKADINRLVDKPKVEPRLDAARTPTAIRSQVGLERRGAGELNSEEITVESSDGLFTFIVLVAKV